MDGGRRRRSDAVSAGIAQQQVGATQQGLQVHRRRGAGGHLILPRAAAIAVDAGCGAVNEPFDPASLAKAIDEVLKRTRTQAHRAAVRRFGRENAWENEREILLAEFARLCPALAADRDINAPDTAVGVLE